jgi:hypothetical protein
MSYPERYWEAFVNKSFRFEKNRYGFELWLQCNVDVHPGARYFSVFWFWICKIELIIVAGLRVGVRVKEITSVKLCTRFKINT